MPPLLSLTLLELRVFLVDDVDLSLSTNHDTISGTFFHRRSDFHDCEFTINVKTGSTNYL